MGTIPIGTLIGGALGDAIGLRTTLLVDASGAVLAFMWVLLSPIRTLREQPQMQEIAGTRPQEVAAVLMRLEAIEQSGVYF